MLALAADIVCVVIGDVDYSDGTAQGVRWVCESNK